MINKLIHKKIFLYINQMENKVVILLDNKSLYKTTISKININDYDKIIALHSYSDLNNESIEIETICKFTNLRRLDISIISEKIIDKIANLQQLTIFESHNGMDSYIFEGKFFIYNNNMIIFNDHQNIIIPENITSLNMLCIPNEEMANDNHVMSNLPNNLKYLQISFLDGDEQIIIENILTNLPSCLDKITFVPCIHPTSSIHAYNKKKMYELINKYGKIPYGCEIDVIPDDLAWCRDRYENFYIEKVGKLFYNLS